MELVDADDPPSPLIKGGPEVMIKLPLTKAAVYTQVVKLEESSVERSCDA
jgi:hypothetical protein